MINKVYAVILSFAFISASIISPAVFAKKCKEIKDVKYPMNCTKKCGPDDKICTRVYLDTLKPGQAQVGLYQVRKKGIPELQGIASACDILGNWMDKSKHERFLKKHDIPKFSKARCYQENLDDYLQDNYIPVVPYNDGKNNYNYIADHHHLASSIYLLFKSIDSAYRPYVYIVNQTEGYTSKDSKSVFDLMVKNNQVWPYIYKNKKYISMYSQLKRGQNPFKLLPQSIDDLVKNNDPYRSIFGLARSLNPLKYNKSTANFYQFKWASCLLLKVSPVHKKLEELNFDDKHMPKNILIVKDEMNNPDVKGTFVYCKSLSDSEATKPTPQFRDMQIPCMKPNEYNKEGVCEPKEH